MQGFISYSRQDKKFVKPLYESLTALGYDVWIDEQDIDGGGHGYWKESVVEAIGEGDTFIVVLSPNSTGSDSVEKELNVAANKQRRMIPVMHEQCELTGTFAYELAAVQYIDFPALGFDEGVRRLAARIGLPNKPPKAPPHPPLPPVAWWREPRTMVIAGCVAVLAVIGIVWLVWPDGDDDSTTDEPTQQQAEALVMEWADATTRRDFEEAASIDTSRTAADLENLYRPDTEPTRMVSVEPYIVDAMAEGDLWRLTGAAMALDYDPEPDTRTHVICSDWLVDVAAGTLVWEDSGGDFIAPAVAADQYGEAFAESCS